MPPLRLAVIASLERSDRPGRRLDPTACDLAAAADAADSLARAGHRVDILQVERDLHHALDEVRYDGAFLALHGELGGSGAVQRLLESRGVPMAAPGAEATAAAFDKLGARRRLAHLNLPVPGCVLLAGRDDRDPPASPAALALLGWPCVLKPRHGAHGDGVERLDDAGAVASAFARALTTERDLLVERDHGGLEIQVALLDGVALGAALVERDEHATVVTSPPPLRSGRVEGLLRMAVRAAEGLALTRGLVRADFLVDAAHNEVLIEVEPLPSLHRASVACRIAQSAGLDHPTLMAQLAAPLQVPAPQTWHRRAAVTAVSAHP